MRVRVSLSAQIFSTLNNNNSGEVISRLVDVKRFGSNSAMSMNELSNLDEIEFQLHDCDDSPGVLLKKDGNVVWTPIAARTRSRVHFKDNYTN